MRLTVLAGACRASLDARLTRLMRVHTRLSENGAAVIVPEQSSFSEEQRLISVFGTVGLGNPEALSFKRLFNRLAPRFPSGRTRLGAAAREMAVFCSLNAVRREELRLFGGVVRKRELASTVSGLLTGFKRYGVTSDALKAAEEGIAQGSPLQKKVHDCRIALESYDNFMGEASLADADDDERELVRILGLPECDFFDGKTVFMRYFSDLNRPQLQCVGAMCRRADAVFAAVCWEDKPEFATSKKLIAALRRTAEENGCEFELEIVPAEDDNRPAPLVYLGEGYYDRNAKPFDKTVGQSIFLHVSRNPSAEVRRVGAAIARLAKNGVRYGDIVVAARNIETYGRYIKRTFPLYSIPLFADEKRPLSRHSAAAYVLSASELALHGFSRENVFAFAKNPFAPHEGRCEELEDYCIEAGVRSWNWSENFTFIRGAYSSLDYNGKTKAEDLTLINERRKEIYALIEPLAELFSRPRTGNELVRGLYDFMLAAELPQKIDAAAKKRTEAGDLRSAAETRQVYNLLVGVLDDACTVFGENEVEPTDFCETLKAACAAVQIGVVPPEADSVAYGDIERMKGVRAKYVFILGLNEDVFPRAFANNSIFTEYEADELRGGWGIELPPTAAEKTENEKLLVYTALSMAEKRLYLSLSVSSEGQNLRPSPIIKRVKELFPCLAETQDIDSPQSEYLCVTKAAAFLELGTAVGENRPERFWSLLRTVLGEDKDYAPRLERLERSLGYSGAETEPLDGELLKKTAGDVLPLSASRLDSYGECPFSYFLKYVLRLREVEPMNINFADSGNLLHNIIDGFCRRVSLDLGGNWKRVSDDYTERVFASVAEEIRLGLSAQLCADPRLKAAVDRIETVARKCVEEIRRQIEEELFVPSGNEIVIGEDGEIPPSEISLPDGTRAKFTGRIDRADKRRAVITDDDGEQREVELVRIIDYKSSRRDVDFGELLCGLRLQLFAYIDCYTRKYSESRPAAALYFNLSPPPTELPIGEEEPPRALRLGGVGVEGRIESAEGITEVTSEEMKTILNYTRLSIRRTAEAIIGGKMPVSPLRRGKGLSCRYCPNADICRFDVWGREEQIREAPSLKKEQAIEQMKTELKEGNME